MPRTFISAYWDNNIRHNVTAEHVSRALKIAVGELKYPTLKGIPV